MFPLVQLPKKFKAALVKFCRELGRMFPLVQLPKKFKEIYTDHLGRCMRAKFPLVQLPKKFKVFYIVLIFGGLCLGFPLVQLPKKFKGYPLKALPGKNSTAYFCGMQNSSQIIDNS